MTLREGYHYDAEGNSWNAQWLSCDRSIQFFCDNNRDVGLILPKGPILDRKEQ